MWLIVGLGNPGARYLLNRHNFGFMVVDAFLHSIGGAPSKLDQKALVAKFRLDDKPLIVAKPMTFMNRSGEAVKALVDYYQIDLGKLIVIHDEIDQDFGTLKIQYDRGAAGHNGIKDINEQLGTQAYCRMRLGVGRPESPNEEIANYVLRNFSPEEQQELPLIFDKAIDALELFLDKGFETAASQVNAK